jgi:hypothetical protein
MGQLIAFPGWESEIVPGMGLVLKSHSVVLQSVGIAASF